MFGDEQGSATVMMQVTLGASGAMAPAAVTDPISRNAYAPYGAVRGADNLSIDHGWLNQVSDEASTGLTYLNARYYDSGTSRFVSPDPLMNPADPRTLDAFMYSNNNPVTYTDANGLCAIGGWKYVGGVLEAPCNSTNGNDPRYDKGRFNLPDYNHGDSGWQLTGGAIGKNPGYEKASKAKARGIDYLPGGESACATYECMSSGWNDTDPNANPNGARSDQAGPGFTPDPVYMFFFGDDAEACESGSGLGAKAAGCGLLASNFFPGGGEAKWSLKGGGKLLKWIMKIFKHGDEAAEVATTILKGPIPDAIPKNLPERLALDTAKQGYGTQIMGAMADTPRLVANYGDGIWVKMQYVLRGNDYNVTVHYFRNLDTGLDVERKFVP